MLETLVTQCDDLLIPRSQLSHIPGHSIPLGITAAASLSSKYASLHQKI